MTAGRTALLTGRVRVAVGLALVVAVAALFLTQRDSAVFTTLEGQTLDWRFQLRGARAPGGDVVILAIDDRTLEATGPWPLPRETLADLMLAVGRDGARVIAIDLLLGEARARTGPGAGAAVDSAADPARALPAAFAVLGNAAVAFAFTTGAEAAPAEGAHAALSAMAFRVAREPGSGAAPPLIRPTGIIAPADDILAVAAAGHVNIVVDAGGQLRYALPALAYAGDYYPSLPVVAVRLWNHLGLDDMAVRIGEGVDLGGLAVPTDAQMRQVVDYYGPARSFTHYSAIDLLEGRLPAGTFRDRLVIVGAAATGIGDVFSTPFTPVLPGVEYLATVTDNMLGGHVLRSDDTTRAIDLAIILLLGALAAIVGALLRPLAGAVTLAVLAGLFLAGLYFAFAAAGLWLNAVFPLAAILALMLWNTIAHVMQEGRLRRVAEQRGSTLARFVSPMAERTAQPAGQAVEAAVLFVDIRGFTGIAETMTPAAAMALLSDFHAGVEETVARHQGVVDKFIGDGAMAVFGLDRPGPAAARAALSCAVELARRHGGTDAAPVGGLPEGAAIRIGIGLDYGPVEIGEIGSARRAEVTLAGDTVNVASRLEALTREHGVAVIASDALFAAARNSGDAGAFAGFDALPEQRIRGRRAPIRAWAWSPGSRTPT